MSKNQKQFNGGGKLDIQRQKTKTKNYFDLNLTFKTDHTLKYKMLTLLEQDIGKKLWDPEQGKEELKTKS